MRSSGRLRSRAGTVLTWRLLRATRLFLWGIFYLWSSWIGMPLDQKCSPPCLTQWARIQNLRCAGPRPYRSKSTNFSSPWYQSYFPSGSHSPNVDKSDSGYACWSLPLWWTCRLLGDDILGFRWARNRILSLVDSVLLFTRRPCLRSLHCRCSLYSDF